MPGSVVSVNVSDGGVPKLPVKEATITADGLSGDRQRNRRHHGGPDRAVCLLAVESIEALSAQGHPIFPGSTGENITVQGLRWAAMVPGVRLRVGGAELELTAYAEPCKTIRKSFADSNIALLSHGSNPGHSRVYAKVLREGKVAPGDPVELLVDG
jgi:MOSC domain-containing protein YiiM